MSPATQQPNESSACYVPRVVFLVRLVAVGISMLWKPRLTLLDESVITIRVWPNDLDLNLHMNNGRYLSAMDLGRMDLFARAGVLLPALRRGWYPLLGEAKIRFRRPLAPFAKYRLRTRLLGWDEKWFYGEQIFDRNGEQAAVALVRGLLRGKEGNIAPDRIVALGGSAIASPPMPETVARWRENRW